MDLITAAGIGLDYDSIRLERTTAAWLTAGIDLRNRVAEILDGLVADVAAIGSSSVLGLLAKPIIDLAVGLSAGRPLAPVATRLADAGWIYRGDAGNDGGHVFVLEAWSQHRVAHLHVVKYDGNQWRNYLHFRDLLRRSPDARRRYEAVKLQLAWQVPADRKAYTTGKTDVVTALIRGID
jgi:GrpB-like predicted nucleotidyltransferase (UPF0157 family)